MTNFVVGDADSIIALACEGDSNHAKAQKISEQLLVKKYQVIYPNTVIIEAITTIKRALNLPDKAQFVNKQYQQGIFNIEYTNEDVMQKASAIFEKAVSKKNTLFDAIVAATAQKLGTKEIFSFDNWYRKLGFVLTS